MRNNWIYFKKYINKKSGRFFRKFKQNELKIVECLLNYNYGTTQIFKKDIDTVCKIFIEVKILKYNI